MFIEADKEIQHAQQTILRRYPKWVLSVRSSRWADPWVLATAQVKELVVVHYETRSGSPDHPSIHRVCNDLGLQQKPFIEMVRDESWIF